MLNLLYLRSTLLLIILPLTLIAQRSAQEVISIFAGTQVLKNAQIAVDVRDLNSGRSLASFRPEMAMIPASTQKLITTAVAMDVLGEDFRFKTRLVRSGDDLYIVGGGDPSLGSPLMEDGAGLDEVIDDWVSAVKTAGITEISGAVIGDGSRYASDGAASSWPWADMGNYYGAGAYGLNINENSYYLSLSQRQREGDRPPVIGTEPAVPELKFTNELTSGPRGSGDQAYIFASPFSYQAAIRGSIPVGTGRFRIRGSLPDPALFAAELLTDRLRAAGIVVVHSATTTYEMGKSPGTDAELLHVRSSPPLAELVDRTNLTSNNLFAETLLRELNHASGNRATSETEVIVDWLSGNGLDVTGLRLEDGSGLSPRNFFPPSLLTALLVNRAAQERWRQSIPLAGRTGSMKQVLKGTVAEGRVWGKSGTVSAVRAYAGYIDRSDGRRLAFSIAVNNHTVPGSELNRLIYQLMLDLCTAGL